MVDLPSLNSLILGSSALQGRYDANCSLTMQSTKLLISTKRLDLPKLGEIVSEGHSFYYPCTVVLKGIDKGVLSTRHSISPICGSSTFL